MSEVSMHGLGCTSDDDELIIERFDCRMRVLYAFAVTVLMGV